MIFNVPEVGDFCHITRNGVTECGGPEGFFKELMDEPFETVRKVFPETGHQRTLIRLIDDTSYRDIFLNHINGSEDRDFIQGLLDGWKIWSEGSPLAAQSARLYMLSTFNLINSGIPDQVNVVLSCSSVLNLSALSEAFTVKTVMKLLSANKEIGGPHALVMAGRLTQFLSNIESMLSSLMLRRTEVGLFKVSEERSGIIADVLAQLAEIQQAIVNLRSQFESMKTG